MATSNLIAPSQGLDSDSDSDSASLHEGIRPRRFQAFCVGLPKTGTTSLKTIFDGYRSSKLQGSGMKQLICDVREHRRPRSDLTAFVLARDAERCLEMDATSSNWAVVDDLRDHFPAARFVLTIRDCYSWCDSLLNVLVGRDTGTEFFSDSALFRRFFGCDLELFGSPESVLAHRETIFDALLAFWTQQSVTAVACPPARTLVVRTGDISSHLGQIAQFVGVPLETLVVEQAHSRKTVEKFDLLRQLDREFLENAFAKAASSELMREYFPSTSLETFLNAPEQEPRALRPRNSHARGGPADSGPVPRQLDPTAYWTERIEAATAAKRTDLVERFREEMAALGLAPPAPRVVTDAPPGGRRGEPRTAPEPDEPPSAPELLQAMAIVRALAARDLPAKFGHRLEAHSLRATGGEPRGLLTFVREGRSLVLEVALRRGSAGHWLASERFAISYRPDAPATVLADLDLATRLLATFERHVKHFDRGG